MARGAAQQQYRASCARISLEIPKEMKAEWDAYAAAQGLPTGRMIREAVERERAAAKAASASVQPQAAAQVKTVSSRKPSWGGIACMEED